MLRDEVRFLYARITSIGRPAVAGITTMCIACKNRLVIIVLIFATVLENGELNIVAFWLMFVNDVGGLAIQPERTQLCVSI